MATAGALPAIRPMLATAGPVPAGPGWAYEFKWDGVRALVYLDHGRLTVLSRNGRDVTASYPELAELAAAYPRRRLVLDGEIVALGPDGAPGFALLQQRMHVPRPTAALRARVPVHLYAFDLLHRDADATLALPYRRRRTLLDDLALPGPTAQTPPYWSDTDPRDVVAAAAELGLEGVMAKRLDSAYHPGRRSPAWIKTPRSATIEVVIGGWKPGAGRRTGLLGSLLLGTYDSARRLRYIGHVGTGFTEAALRDLGARLAPLRRDDPPYDDPVPAEHARGALWCEPRLVGEVAFRAWTPDRRLRHPSWRGLRPDRDPTEVRLDEFR